MRDSLKPETAAVAVSNDKPREACGIFGAHIPGHEAARVAFYGVFALQHRGQESAGIAASDGDALNLTADVGLVSQVFAEDDLDTLRGHLAIAHTRYSTTGSNRRQNAQPLIAYGPRGELALGHNGNVINAVPLREYCQTEFGSEFTGSSDSEVIAELYAKTPGEDWFEVSDKVMSMLSGAYSLIMMTKHELIAVRDPLGVRPLCLGSLDGGWVFASESTALDILDAEFERELEPGEVMVVNREGIESRIWSKASEKHKMCIFEQIYFARPDSIIEGGLAYENRLEMGKIAFRENPVDADLVIGIPDSSTPHATGFANEANIPYVEGLVKNRYVGRTFIQPDQYMREIGVKTKFNAMKPIIKGKRIVVVDDSIVRSTTVRHVVRMLRDAGATEVHVRVAAPPIKSTCHFGVDMATIDQLIAANHSIDEICEIIGAGQSELSQPRRFGRIGRGGARRVLQRLLHWEVSDRCST